MLIPDPEDLVVTGEHRPFRQIEPLYPCFEILSHENRFSNSAR
mgnify:CR=1 FL=1